MTCQIVCCFQGDFLTSSQTRAKQDLAQLSQLGHFLKGSSATLGLTKVKDSCEMVQHYGARMDKSGTNDEPDDDISLRRIKDTLAVLKVDYAEVEKKLKVFYHDLNP